MAFARSSAFPARRGSGAAAPAPAAAENCVVSPAEHDRRPRRGPGGKPGTKALESAPSALGAGTWSDGIFVLPFSLGGSYDRDLGGAPNVAPRQWVAQSFFAANPDQYDFVLVLTNFNWDAGPQTRGLYWSIANDVAGIGVDPVDLSPQFGSDHLQGYIDGMFLRDYRLADGSLDQQRVREILNHELGHRWLVHPHFDDAGTESAALLGRDGAHWSYLLDSDASFLYGSDWTANGDGTYTATAVRKRFSALDLYLMGLLPASAVSPLTLLVNPAIDATEIPRLGDTIAATPQTVTIDQLIAAEGARSPDFQASQKEFRIGVIYLYDPAQGLYTEDLALARDLKSFWRQSFFRETRGRAVVEVGQRSEPVVGGTGRPHPFALLAGFPRLGRPVERLRGDGGARQRRGARGARPGRRLPEPGRRRPPGPAFGGGGVGRAAIAPARGAGQVGERHRHQQPAAGRGLGRPECRRRLRRPAALRRRPRDQRPRRAPPAAGKAGRRRTAPGPGSSRGRIPTAAGRGRKAEALRSAATLEVALAARVLDPAGFFARPEVASAYNFLLARRVDGGLGDNQPNVAQTALFLQFVVDQPIDQAIVQAAIDFLSHRQRADGSWEGSVYKTALAAAALQTFLLPDPFIDPGEALADPAAPFVDEPATLLAAVRNGGTFLAAGTEYAWQFTRRGESAPRFQLTGTLPALAEVGFFTVEQTAAARPAAGRRLRPAFRDRPRPPDLREVARQRRGGPLPSGCASIPPGSTSSCAATSSRPCPT